MRDVSQKSGMIALAILCFCMRTTLAWADEAPMAQPMPAAATPTQDSPDIAKLYDAAMDDMLQGRLDAAIAGFDDVALRSVEPHRRALAADLPIGCAKSSRRQK